MAARIGLFGGTFDPPHIGHFVAALEVREALGLDMVHLVVANDPWQKSSVREVSPAAGRVEMVRAGIDGVAGLAVCDIELDRGGPSYTIDTVEWVLRGGLGSALRRPEVTLILGSDAASGLQSWHRGDDLARRVDVAVVARPGEPEWAGLPEPWRCSTVNVSALEVSSTDIRARVRGGRSIAYLVPDPVVRIIYDRGLYASRDEGGRTAHDN